MAVYDLEEQEQIEEIKAWWKQYRMLILLVVMVAAATFAAIQGWGYYNSRQAFESGELYMQLQGAVSGGDGKKVQDIAAVLADKYPRTGYASFAALAAAKAAFDGGDAANAKLHLQWVIDNGRDVETRDIARLRLGAVLLDEKKYDDALQLLAAGHADSLSALYADLSGDILVAQGKPGAARGAYQLALDKSEARSAYRALIQVKLDALGATQ